MNESDRNKRRQTTGIVVRLFMQYPVQNMTPDEFKIRLGDYVNELLEFEPEAVENACRKWWRDKDNTWPPHVGALIEICKQESWLLKQAYAEKVEAAHKAARLAREAESAAQLEGPRP